MIGSKILRLTRYRGKLQHTLLSSFHQPKDLLQSIRLHYVRSVSSERHIFVLGPPRSGTTLIKQIIRCSPAVVGPDKETFFFARRRLISIDIDEIDIRRLNLLKSQAIDKVNLFDRVAEEYKNGSSDLRFIEKTPEHALFLDKLIRWFPKSAFVFVYRDGRDAAVSARRNPSVSRDIKSYARLWRDIIRLRLSLGDDPRIFDLQYETFCANPSESTEKLFQFLDLPTGGVDISSFSYAKTIYSKQPGHERLNGPISSETVATWRQFLSPEEIALFENIAHSELRKLRYAPEKSGNN